MEADIRVRRAKPMDVAHIIAMVKATHGDGDDILPPIEDAVAISELLNLIVNHTVLIAYHERRIVGVIVLQAVKHFWNTSKMFIINPWLTVLHEYRTTDASEKLIVGAQQVAEESGLPLIISVSSKDRPLVKDRFIRKNGLQYIGGNFIYNSHVTGASHGVDIRGQHKNDIEQPEVAG